jgi:hypothetical protein
MWKAHLNFANKSFQISIEEWNCQVFWSGQVPIRPNTIFPILHIFVRFSQKYGIFLQICEELILPMLYK